MKHQPYAFTRLKTVQLLLTSFIYFSISTLQENSVSIVLFLQSLVGRQQETWTANEAKSGTHCEYNQQEGN